MDYLEENTDIAILEDAYEDHFDAEIGSDIPIKDLDGLILQQSDFDGSTVVYNLVEPSSPNKILGVVYIYRR